MKLLTRLEIARTAHRASYRERILLLLMRKPVRFGIVTFPRGVACGVPKLLDPPALPLCPAGVLQPKTSEHLSILIDRFLRSPPASWVLRQFLPSPPRLPPPESVGNFSRRSTGGGKVCSRLEIRGSSSFHFPFVPQPQARIYFTPFVNRDAGLIVSSVSVLEFVSSTP